MLKERETLTIITGSLFVKMYMRNVCNGTGFIKRETLKEAYDYCFGNALAEYNYKQKRKDRIYIHEIEHSGNKEKVFYENVVQIGKMEDIAVIDENGNLAEAAVQVIKVLD